MERTVLSADELRKKVEKLVNAIPEIVDDEAKVVTPAPQPQEIDRDGCNWDMGSFKGGADYENEIREAVEHVREKFNLAHK
jgi:hypothetical protein